MTIFIFYIERQQTENKLAGFGLRLLVYPPHYEYENFMLLLHQ